MLTWWIVGTMLMGLWVQLSTVVKVFGYVRRLVAERERLRRLRYETELDRFERNERESLRKMRERDADA